MNNSCIYCGATPQDKELSKSDIIPDALTNTKILNPNVCKIDHNSKFSDMFEYKIIEGLAFITNELDIKSSKSDKYHPFQQTIIVDETEYKARISSDYELFKGNKFLKSLDNTSKLGPIDKVQKIPNIKYTEVNVNELEIEKRININIDLFFCNEMYRLIAKIAFEWFCLMNEINQKKECFSKIIQFIETGNDNGFVTIVNDKKVHSLFNNESPFEFGSHTILSYIAKDGSVNVLVSLFGISIYNVKLLSQKNSECKNIASLSSLTINSKHYQFRESDIAQLENKFRNSFNYIKLRYISIASPKNVKDTSLIYQQTYLLNYSVFQNIHCIDTPTDDCIDILSKKIENLLQTSSLTIRGLKRFINDNQLDKRTIELNPNGTDKKSIFLFYILMIIGKSSAKITSSHAFYKLMNTMFEENLVITDEYTENIKKELFTEKATDFISKGAKIILEIS